MPTKDPSKKTVSRRNTPAVKPLKQGALTFDQQRTVRTRMMATASRIAAQLHQYAEEGRMVVAGREIPLTSERLAAYRLILERTVPALSATEITHTTAMEQMSSAQLVERLGELVKARPELADRLWSALGGRVINATPKPAGPNGASESASPVSPQ